MPAASGKAVIRRMLGAAVRVQIDVRRVCSALEADRGSLKLVFRHLSLRRPPMKVFGLQAPIYRGASLSSRLTAQTSQLAALRRDALERWRRARSRGLSAEEAARAVGASRASLYRWEKRLEPRSRRPHRQRQPTPPRRVATVGPSSPDLLGNCW